MRARGDRGRVSEELAAQEAFEGRAGGRLARTGAALLDLWLRLAAWKARLLPRRLAYWLASLLGVALHLAIRWRDPRRARRGRGVSRNARLALGPAASPAQVRGLVRDFARHLAWLVTDLLRLERVIRSPDRVDASQLVPLLEERRGKGVLVITGHMGSWEHLPIALARMGHESLVLARPFPVQGVQRWLLRTRRRGGVDVRSKFGGLWSARKALQAGRIVGMVVDENDRQGTFVPFCGVLAATNTSPAQLQRLARCPIVVATCQRVELERWRVHVWEVLEPRPEEEREAGERRVTAAIAAALERALRSYPEQWLWSLRRWETRPPGEAPGPDGLPPRAGPGLLEPPAPSTPALAGPGSGG